MPEPVSREALADECEQHIALFQRWWQVSGSSEQEAHRASAVRDLAEAAVILRTQQMPGVTYR